MTSAAELRADFADLFDGDPDALTHRTARLRTAAEAIAQATEALRDLVGAQDGTAVDAVGHASRDTADALSRSHGRYSRTATALTTYAVELAPIQQTARAALDDADEDDARANRLRTDIWENESATTRAAAQGMDTDDLRDDYWRLQDDLAAAGGGVEAARRTLVHARDDLRAAADRAIAVIEIAIEAGKDSFADDWNGFWDDVGDVFDSVGKWIAGVIGPILDALGQLLSALVSALIVALAVVLAVLIVGALLATVFGTLLLIAAALLLGGAILAAYLSEVAARPVQLDEDGQPKEPKPSTDDTEARDYGDLIEQVGEQDANGGEEHTEIRVVAVYGADGTITGWRVQLPSTQNWSPTNTTGALNDARTDLMLSLFPGVPTQYEQAVWDAMTDAGVFTSTAPIMFTGWSLGGMMAGNLAADPRVADRVQSVVTAGSAIDKYASDIPGDVRVTQINNGFDPVHTLEFVGLDPLDALPHPNWQTYRPLVVDSSDGWVHGSQLYSAAADAAVPTPRPGDEVFFATPGSASYEMVYTSTYTRGS